MGSIASPGLGPGSARPVSESGRDAGGFAAGWVKPHTLEPKIVSQHQQEDFNQQAESELRNTRNLRAAQHQRALTG